MCSGPVKNSGQFFPVFHFFVFELFHRSTGDNETIVFVVFYLIKISIEFRMCSIGVFLEVCVLSLIRSIST